LTAADYQAVIRPHEDGAGRIVWIHTVTTIVRNLYCNQVLIVRDTADGPVSDVRFLTTSDVHADAATLFRQLAV
jgi:hypothetical protein